MDIFSYWKIDKYILILLKKKHTFILQVVDASSLQIFRFF